MAHTPKTAISSGSYMPLVSSNMSCNLLAQRSTALACRTFRESAFLLMDDGVGFNIKVGRMEQKVWQQEFAGRLIADEVLNQIISVFIVCAQNLSLSRYDIL